MARKISGSDHHRANERRAGRRAEHEARVAKWQELSPAEQLALLDHRLGEGVGAKRQRERLSNAL
jgi:hypothetical protein